MVIKEFRTKIDGFAVLLAAVSFSVLSAVTENPIYVLALSETLIMGIAVGPSFKGRENISMYTLLTVASGPVNVKLIIKAMNTDAITILTDDSRIIGIMLGILLYGFLFSIEQIYAAVMVRIIWRDQMPTEKDDKDEKQEVE